MSAKLRLLNIFFESERMGGALLIGCTLVSLLLSNSIFEQVYVEWWHMEVAGHTITHWINDGLMTVFFLLIGLELKRELYTGELADAKRAVFPVMAAVGGMVVPAIIFLAFNWGTAAQSGAGIPMATDIAFAIGILSLAGNRIPAPLKTLLTAIAVIDDLGAIVIIALFYTEHLILSSLGFATGCFVFLLVLNRFKVNLLFPYLAGGAVMWYCLLQSGVHPTVSGILLAFAIPFGNGNKNTPSYLLQHALHKPVTFMILPLFALANTTVKIDATWYADLFTPQSLGIFLGLFAGKPLGIVLFGFVFTYWGGCVLPKGLTWKHIWGIGMLGGIGFTMSVFITLLAYDEPFQITQSKITILIASLFSGIAGYTFLRLTLKKP